VAAGVPSSSADIVLNCGTSQFDSTTLTYSTWCGQAQPTPSCGSERSPAASQSCP